MARPPVNDVADGIIGVGVTAKGGVLAFVKMPAVENAPENHNRAREREPRPTIGVSHGAARLGRAGGAGRRPAGACRQLRTGVRMGTLPAAEKERHGSLVRCDYLPGAENRGQMADTLLSTPSSNSATTGEADT